MKNVLEDSGLLLKGVSETIKDEANEQKGGFFSMLLGTLGVSLLGNMLAGKIFIRAGEGAARAGYGSKGSSFKDLRFKKKMIPPHSLTNFQIQIIIKMNLDSMRFILDINLPDKIKDGAYVINLDEYSDIRTHWIALYVNTKTVTYFDSFGVEHIPKGIKSFINNKNIMANIVRI